MGVKDLNSYLSKNCKDGIIKCNLSNLKNKTIVIDIFIYIYMFMANDNVYESIFNMCFKFKKYNITPIFVFDGKTPKEKLEEVKSRKVKKLKAKEEYDNLSIKLDEMKQKGSYINDDYNHIKNKMRRLKRSFVKITDDIISNTKTLISACGFNYIQAPFEADPICAKIVKDNMAYAVMSEDMDYFVYGCDKIIRYFSVIKETYVEYDYKTILSSIDISDEIFKQICILSGTDYKGEKFSIDNNIKYYRENKESIDLNKSDKYYYFKERSLEDTSSLINVYEQFNIDDVEINDIDKNVIRFTFSWYNQFDIMKILIHEGFVMV